jgi:hypothetical protein
MKLRATSNMKELPSADNLKRKIEGMGAIIRINKFLGHLGLGRD